MQEHSDFDFGVFFGIALGIAFSCLLGALVESQFDIHTLVREYQTLLGALLALIGAIATVWVVRQQIYQAKQEFESREIQRQRGATALLPSALSELCRHSRAATDRLWQVYQTLLGSKNPELGTEFDHKVMRVSLDHLSIVRENIECTAPADREALLALLETYRVFDARWSSIFLPEGSPRKTVVVSTQEFAELFVSGVEVYVRASAYIGSLGAAGQPRPVSKLTFDDIYPSVWILSSQQFDPNKHIAILKILKQEYGLSTKFVKEQQK